MIKLKTHAEPLCSQKLLAEEAGQVTSEQIIRDCIAVPMKSGCEKREMSNYKLYKKPTITMTQCVFTCHESNGCNASSSLQLSALAGLISLMYAALSVIKYG